MCMNLCMDWEGKVWLGDVLYIRRGGREGGEWGRCYRIEMAVPFAHCIEGLHSVVGVQVEQEAFEPRHLAVLRLVYLRKRVDACDSFFDRFQLVRRDAVAFVDHDDIGVGDLQVCGSHMHAPMLCIPLFLNRLLVQTQKDILRIDKCDDAIQVDRAAQTIIDPEKWSKVARVRETGCFEEDVVKGAFARHEGFDGVDAGVFDRAADAAVGQLEPFLRLLTVLSDCKGFLDIGRYTRCLSAESDSCTD